MHMQKLLIALVAIIFLPLKLIIAADASQDEKYFEFRHILISTNENISIKLSQGQQSLRIPRYSSLFYGIENLTEPIFSVSDESALPVKINIIRKHVTWPSLWHCQWFKEQKDFYEITLNAHALKDFFRAHQRIHIDVIFDQYGQLRIHGKTSNFLLFPFEKFEP